jgi:hypothetical protein
MAPTAVAMSTATPTQLLLLVFEPLLVDASGGFFSFGTNRTRAYASVSIWKLYPSLFWRQ